MIDDCLFMYSYTLYYTHECTLIHKYRYASLFRSQRLAGQWHTTIKEAITKENGKNSAISYNCMIAQKIDFSPLFLYVGYVKLIIKFTLVYCATVCFFVSFFALSLSLCIVSLSIGLNGIPNLLRIVCNQFIQYTILQLRCYTRTI